MIIFWVVFIGLILAGLNYLFNPKTGVSQAALDVLKARYAKGEINQEEFKKIKKDLSE
jgi:putative membrane protein